MLDIALVQAIANICFPFLFLLAWWNVHKHNKENAKSNSEIKEHLASNDRHMNSRLDELISAKEKIARMEGHRQGLAEGILVGQGKQ